MKAKTKMPEQTNRLLTVNDIAERAQVSARQVYRWIDDSLLPVVRLGRLIRIKEDDFSRFVNGNYR